MAKKRQKTKTVYVTITEDVDVVYLDSRDLANDLRRAFLRKRKPRKLSITKERWNMKRVRALHDDGEGL